VAIAAAWSIARLGVPEAAPVIERLARSDVPELRALGALGLGRAGGSRDASRSLALLSDMAQASAFGPLPRAAAAHALGMRMSAPKGERADAFAQSPAWAALTSLLDASDGLVQEHALWALARRGSPAVEPALAEALVSQDARARSVALAAAAAYGAQAARAPENQSNEEGTSSLPDPLGLIPEGHLDVALLLEGALPVGATPAAAARALVRLEDALQAAAELAARTSSERALVVARALTARGGEPAFGELTTRLDAVLPALREEAERAARAITQRSAPAYLSLVHHDEAAVRAAAISVLGLLPGNAEARAALQGALLDPAPSVQDAAFEALGRSAQTQQREALAQLLESSDDWRLRHRAAQALGVSLARGGASGEGAAAVTALERAKKQDPSRLVRDTAADALAQASRPAAKRLDQAPPPPLE
jgi:HEAT repeat protein